jgi:NhaP-type Na+/H+ or K+/H+ antiporter
MLSTDQTLGGLGLMIVLALACRLVSGRLRLPAIILLLPVGFVAGAATDDVHPDALLGNAYQPLVSLGVGLILFEAGLRLRFDELRGRTRGVVGRLVVVGPLVTGIGVALAVKLLFGLEWASRPSSGRSSLSRGRPWCSRCSRSCAPRTGCGRF